MNLNISPNCGNSPKKDLVKNLTIYFASYDIEKAMDFMDENIVWNLVGDEPVIGKEQFRVALDEMKQYKVHELTIHSIITHGKEAAVNGEMVMESGNIFGFSDFYEFWSASGSKVKGIVSYVIKTNKKVVASKIN